MSDIKVSVLMIAYNHGDYIRQSVESVFAQETNFEFEVIVGEDCSPEPDKGREILLELKQKYGDRLILLLHEKNLGPSKNYSSVHGLARGKYTAPMECDDYWTDPHKLQRQYDMLEAHPEYSACGSESCIVDDNGKVTVSKTLLIKKDRLYVLRDYQRNGFSVHGNSLLYRSELLPFHSEKYQKLRASCTTMGDVIRFNLLYAYGPIYVFKDVMHAHREGAAVASSFSAQQKTRMVSVSYLMMDIAKALDVYFDYQKDHSFLIVNRIAAVMRQYLLHRKKFDIPPEQIRQLYMANPFGVRVRILLKIVRGTVRHIYRRIKRKLMR